MSGCATWPKAATCHMSHRLSPLLRKGIREEHINRSQAVGSDSTNRLCPMFPLSYVRVHAHTGHETSAHKKTWSAHKCSFQSCFCPYFILVIQNSDEFR